MRQALDGLATGKKGKHTLSLRCHCCQTKAKATPVVHYFNVPDLPWGNELFHQVRGNLFPMVCVDQAEGKEGPAVDVRAAAIPAREVWLQHFACL